MFSSELRESSFTGRSHYPLPSRILPWFRASNTGRQHGVAWREASGEAMKLTLDLHDVYNRGQDIDRALR